MLTRTELETFAVEGVRGRVIEIEKELAKYHKTYPNLFLSPTVPQLLKAQPKNGANGNGHWPKLTATPAEAPTDKRVGGWTEARRKKFSATMKAKFAAKRAAKKDTKFGSEEHRAKMRASWTPERRRKMARLMKKRSKAMHAAKRALRG